MEFYKDDKKVRYNPYNMKHDKKLGEGMEAVAYKVGGEAVKFYKPYCNKLRMSKESIDKFKEIKTTRILMPTSSLVDKKRNIKGYSMQYVEDLGEYSFFNLPHDKLNKEMDILKEDVNTISDHKVFLNDLNSPNTIYHNGLYLIDPGSYCFSTVKKNDEVRTFGINIENINMYLIYEIINHYALVRTNNRKLASEVSKSVNFDYLRDKSRDVMEFFKDGIGDRTLSEYTADKISEVKKH